MSRTPVSIDEGGRRARVLARRDRLVEAHLEIVPPIARRIHNSLPPSFDLEDLIATGNVALLHAATRYRPKEHNGTPFSAYARPCIRGAILDSVRRRHFTANTMPSIDDPHGDGRPISMRLAAAPQDDLSHELMLQRLEGAVARLTRQQQAVLEQYYAEDGDRLKRAYWRRRRQIAEIHENIITLLRRELAS
jgi:RNA polymerase sigma factor (sigma-70 family)